MTFNQETNPRSRGTDAELDTGGFPNALCGSCRDVVREDAKGPICLRCQAHTERFAREMFQAIRELYQFMTTLNDDEDADTDQDQDQGADHE